MLSAYTFACHNIWTAIIGCLVAVNSNQWSFYNDRNSYIIGRAICHITKEKIGTAPSAGTDTFQTRRYKLHFRILVFICFTLLLHFRLIDCICQLSIQLICYLIPLISYFMALFAYQLHFALS